MYDIFLGYPPQKIVNWLKNKSPIPPKSTMNLSIKSTNGVEYKFDAINEPINRKLAYQSEDENVLEPFKSNIELSDNLKIAEVNDISNEISSICSNSFYRCYNLSSITCLSVKEIGKDAFGYCSNLSSINVPNVLSLGYDAFYNCKFQIFNCPKIEDFNSWTFNTCTNLLSIIISSVTEVPKIGSNVFYGCQTPISVYVKNQEMVQKFQTTSKWSTYYNNGTIEFIAI